VYASDLGRGFVLLEDLGTQAYLAALVDSAAGEHLYPQALDALAVLAARGRDVLHELAPYDEPTLQREMALMAEWFCTRHLQIALAADDRELLATTFAFLCREALAQPVVFVHRDYHSRNLMVLGQKGPGVIDFQDALAGPIGYDLVSLLKDCYVAWPRAQVESWVRDQRARLRAAGFAAGGGSSEREFLRWFDLIGVQRHIKVLGIFARLWYRDGKSGYLADLPRTLDYVRDTCARYPELDAFARWLERRVVPVLPPANARALSIGGPPT
jgi:N-acetylmuramate 1-kinase